MNALIESLKQNGQDHEFYPTTIEIIDAMIRDLAGLRDDRYYGHRELVSVMDIGAGNGKVLRALGERGGFADLYAIEKSPILCQQLGDDIFIIGTEFAEQSLVSKQIDVTFCNPPYSEFEDWAEKIIRESASRVLYLVIPDRWEGSLFIANALTYRTARAKIVGQFDFLRAEDRTARAHVHLLRVEMPDNRDDAFERFFEAEFADLRAKWKGQGEPEDDEGTRRNPRLDALVPGVNYPERLVQLYNAEIDHIRHNYDAVKGLDVDLLREFDVNPVRIMGCLKARLADLRNTYWQELFAHMEPVTSRLTSKKRDLLLRTLNQNGHVDFTVTNIQAVLIWVLKNANRYITEQVIEVFDEMVSRANVRNYASNRRVFTFDRWRYQEEKPSHIALDYRIVLERSGGIRRTDYSFERGLSHTAAEFLGDLLTVAHGLGFLCQTVDSRLCRGESGTCTWVSGEKVEFFCADGSLLFDVRAFLNGNMHIRLKKEFALALNVEVGRLRGWLKSGQEAADELGDKSAARYFGTNIRLGASSLPLLMAS